MDSPSLNTITKEYFSLILIVNFVWKADEGRGTKHCFVNVCSFVVL